LTGGAYAGEADASAAKLFRSLRSRNVSAIAPLESEEKDDDFEPKSDVFYEAFEYKGKKLRESEHRIVELEREAVSLKNENARLLHQMSPRSLPATWKDVLANGVCWGSAAVWGIFLIVKSVQTVLLGG
jgi:hypothetical protein